MDADYLYATIIIDDNVKKAKNTSQNLAYKLNAFLSGNTDNSLPAYYLENIESNFKNAYLFFKSAYIDSILIVRMYDLPKETKEKIFFIKYAYYRIKRLFIDFAILVHYYYTEPVHRDEILNELCDILRQLRSLYL